MELVSFKEHLDVKELCDMWNDEFGFIFPISQELFNKNVVSYGEKILDLSFNAVIDGTVVGFIVGKIWELPLEINGYNDYGWISLIYVKPEFRKQGIGSLLLKQVEEKIASLDKTTIYLGKDYNNFFPGLPVELKYFREWFEKKGYIGSHDTNDLVRKNPKEKLVLVDYKDGKEYVIRKAEFKDLKSLNQLIRSNWPGRWHAEFLDYVYKGGRGEEYMICLDGEQVVGFCKVCNYKTPALLTSYSMNFKGKFLRLGGVGPLGVDINYRKNNIAGNLIKASINDLIDIKTSDIIIDWTNLMHIYHKYGFEIWKSYTYMTKTLK